MGIIQRQIVNHQLFI